LQTAYWLLAGWRIVESQIDNRKGGIINQIWMVSTVRPDKTLIDICIFFGLAYALVYGM